MKTAILLLAALVAGPSAATVASTASSAIAANAGDAVRASVPPGPVLVARMQAAARAKGSAHIDFQVQATTPSGQRQLLVYHVDASWRTNTASLTYGTQVLFGKSKARPFNSSMETVVVGSRAAARTAGGGAWTCQTVPSYMSQLLNLVAGFLGVQRNGARTLGAVSLGGVLTWHVRALEKLAVYSKVARLTPLDLFIRQSDNTAIREDIDQTVPIKGSTIHVQVLGLYSRYGEPVRVKLPAKCKK